MRSGRVNTRRALRVLSALAVAIGLVVSAAPAAYADEHDDAFLKALKRQDILPLGDPTGPVTWAHWACDQLDQGADPYHVVAWLGQYNNTEDPAFDASDAMFLREATIYYCPAHKEIALSVASRSG